SPVNSPQPAAVKGPMTAIESRANARARAAVAALFLTNGALFANMAPRLPELKRDLGLDTASYGLLVTAWPIGAILAGLAAGPQSRVCRGGSCRLHRYRCGVARCLQCAVGSLGGAGLRRGRCHGLAYGCRAERARPGGATALWAFDTELLPRLMVRRSGAWRLDGRRSDPAEPVAAGAFGHIDGAVCSGGTDRIDRK